VRLLLDEHYPAVIAMKLQARGYDIATVAEMELRGEPDSRVLEAAVADQRALVTNNVSDLVALARRYAEDGRRHFGIVLTSDRSIPRTRKGVGALVASLGALMEENPRADALLDRMRWLQAPER